MTIDQVSLQIGKLTAACESLKDGHDDIQKVNSEIFDLMRGMSKDINKMSSLSERVGTIEKTVSEIRMDSAKRRGIQMTLASFFGGGITLFFKRIFESMGL